MLLRPELSKPENFCGLAWKLKNEMWLGFAWVVIIIADRGGHLVSGAALPVPEVPVVQEVPVLTQAPLKVLPVVLTPEIREVYLVPTLTAEIWCTKCNFKMVPEVLVQNFFKQNYLNKFFQTFFSRKFFQTKIFFFKFFFKQNFYQTFFSNEIFFDTIFKTTFLNLKETCSFIYAVQ